MLFLFLVCSIGFAFAATSPSTAPPVPTPTASSPSLPTALSTLTPFADFHKHPTQSTFSKQTCNFDPLFMCCSSKGGQNNWFPCTSGTPPEDLVLGKRDNCDQCWYNDQCWVCSPSGQPTGSATAPGACPMMTC